MYFIKETSDQYNPNKVYGITGIEGDIIFALNTTETIAGNICDLLNENLVLKQDLAESKKGTILTEANELIYGDRAKAYGPVTASFERIAKFWSVILEKEVSPEQVGHCMIALKMSRQLSKAGRDNIVDIAGYAGCIGKMEEEKTAV